ncbi:hypothetical protein BZL30_3627 [Mycobacterium kansasii]|uniref:DUF222 domain-containing protein n=1 Tax=Mycobacterium kansasii TaxID=1768 RepID=A0A1V3XAX6_MYCKA|nr:hypothetical protein BZL30_3627 [Mycobacterium kansasii]
MIRRFCRQLPGWVDQATRERAEAQLARQGGQVRPEQLSGLAATIADCLNPDGTYRDEDRARRRALMLGSQQADGMSELRALITPSGAPPWKRCWPSWPPGHVQPRIRNPGVDGSPSQAAIDTDTRSAAQRSHDGLLAGLRALLASGELGQHNGLPATIIVTTTLAELEAAAGQGLTGGGTLLPMSDVIRLARHARHYLAVFDGGKALALYHSKRLAAPGSESIHHVIPYAQSPSTDVNRLTFACGGHHPLADKGWSTRKNTHGDTEWTPHPTSTRLDQRPTRTNMHHPEKLLHADEDDEHDT